MPVTVPSRIRRHWIDLVVAFVLAIVAFGMVAVNVSHHDALSPIDEYMYVDYASKVPVEGFVHQGELIGDDARTYASCLGVQLIGPVGGCDTTANDAQYPYGAKTISDVHPPTYFWTVWYGSEVFRFLGVDDLLDAMRMTGAVYLALAVAGMFTLARLLGAGRIIGAAFALLVAASPSVHWATAYVSNDAPALALASVVGIVAVLAWRGRISGWWLVLAGAGSVAFKSQFIESTALVLVFSLVALVASRFSALGLDRSDVLRARRLLVQALVTVVASGLVVVGWSKIRAASAVAAQPDLGIATPFTIGTFLDEATNFLPGVLTETGGVPIGVVVQTASVVAGWLIIAGIFASAVVPAVRARTTGVRALALSLIVCLLAVGPALAVLLIVVSGYYYYLPTRYALTLVPVMVAVAALFWSRTHRVVQSAILVGGVVAVVALTI